jgi:hypothetical protein
MFISYDGVTWTSNTTAGNAVWNGSYWCAFSGRSIYKSYDGINWTNTFTAFGEDSLLNDIAWNGNLWMVTAAYYTFEGRVAISYDGINWDTYLTGTDNPRSALKSVVWNGSLWIITAVVGDAEGGNPVVGNAQIATSPNGINWTKVASPLVGSGGFIASRRVLPYVGTKTYGNFSANSGTPSSGAVGDYYIDTSGKHLYSYKDSSNGWFDIMNLTDSYTPSTSSNWATSAPTTVKDALDRMAALLYTLNSNTAIP